MKGGVFEEAVIVTGKFEEFTEIGWLVSPEDIAMFSVIVVDVSTDEKAVGGNGSADVPVIDESFVVDCSFVREVRWAVLGTIVAA